MPDEIWYEGDKGGCYIITSYLNNEKEV